MGRNKDVFRLVLWRRVTPDSKTTRAQCSLFGAGKRFTALNLGVTRERGEECETERETGREKREREGKSVRQRERQGERERERETERKREREKERE